MNRFYRSTQVMKLRSVAIAITAITCIAPPTLAQRDTDATFIADFKRYAAYFPEVKNFLIEGIESRPDLDINSAKAVCDDLQKGATMEQIENHRAGIIAKRADPFVRRLLAVNTAIVQTLATKYYCP